jgi:3-hydroxyacyl-CoA dehydrogenase
MVVSIERDGEVGIVVLDNPPVNALSRELREGIWNAVETLDNDQEVRAVVLIAEGRTFIAGADITEFGKSPEPPHLPDTVSKIESASKPWVAAIHGSALGGGLEVALGCHYRVAAPTAKMGLPEVTLGVVPGAGGTVRLPRLVSAPDAVGMATSGKPVSASKALEIGLIDKIADGDLRAIAVAFARDVADKELPAALSARAPVTVPDAAYWVEAEKTLTQKARGVAAPLRALASLKTAIESDAETAFKVEREGFLELRASDQARALRHVFFAERAATKPPEVKDVTPRPIGSVAVIGGGTMGAGIAAAIRDADVPVVLVERDQEAVARGEANIAAIFDGAVKRGRISQETRDARMAGVRYTTDYGTLIDVDLAIEAVFEDLDIKRAVFAQLEDAMRADAVLATNTSYLDPNAISAQLTDPTRMIGLHFFSPANVMKLLEIVPIDKSAPDVLATGFALGKMLRKIPVLAGICDGFIGNRILKTTRAQAEKLLLSGSTPADVDRAMQAFGMPMGPFAAQDLGGLDIAAFQRKAARERGETPFAPVAERLCAMNRLGQKTGGGWYDYEKGDRKPILSDAVAAVIAEEAAGFPKNANLNDEARVERIVFPMIDEGARILQEGVAKRAADIDLVEIHGYGFPRWRGGLMHYAETRGLDEIVDALKDMAKEGVAPAPCDELIRSAKRGSFLN